MFVREVMTSPAITVRPETTLKQATQLLERHSVTSLPVVDADGQIVGVVSEADVIRDAVLPDPRAHELPVRLSNDARPTSVADVMTNHALTVTAAADLTEAADLMTSTVVKSLPVIDGGKVIGVVSRRDIIRVLARRDDLMEQEIDELIRSAGQDWIVDVVDGVVTVDGPETEHERELARVLSVTVPGVVAIYVKTGHRT